MSGVQVRGGATAEEVAAVLAVLTAQPAAAEPPVDGFAGWRAGRRRALRRTSEPDRPI